MIRAFWTVALAMAAGLVLGGLSAGAAGGALGAVVGCSFGLMFLAVKDSRPHMLREVDPERVPRELLCVPRGRVADCTLVRDKRTGAWLDVERCSLEQGDVRCTKRCLVLMNDVAV